MPESITGIVLAGGQGRRMGGVDKGFQMLNGRPMVQQVLERLRPQVDALLINANRNLDRYRDFGYPVLTDLIADFAGPLAGLQVAMTQANTPLVLTVPCDSPWLPDDLAARLHATLRKQNSQVAIAQTGGQRHPVFCLARRELLPQLTAYLAGGGRKMDGWYAGLAVSHVDFSDEAAAFANLNTADDLQAATSKDKDKDKGLRP